MALLHTKPRSRAMLVVFVFLFVWYMLGSRITYKLQSAQGCSGYTCSAAANLTSYKEKLLQTHLHSFHPFKQDDWHLFSPVITCPPGRPLTKYGQGDGSKLLCNLNGGVVTSTSCVIYSLGSNGDFQFETAMLKETSCQVYTFDCTYNGHSLDQDDRHHYYKWCLGGGSGQYRTWANITNSLGHERVDLLKIDIEGYEYAVLSGLSSNDRLPEEISVEMHVNVTGWSKAQAPESTAELAFTFLHLANLGYATYAQEVNALAPYCCSEFTLMRVCK